MDRDGKKPHNPIAGTGQILGITPPVLNSRYPTQLKRTNNSSTFSWSLINLFSCSVVQKILIILFCTILIFCGIMFNMLRELPEKDYFKLMDTIPNNPAILELKRDVGNDANNAPVQQVHVSYNLLNQTMLASCSGLKFSRKFIAGESDKSHSIVKYFVTVILDLLDSDYPLISNPSILMNAIKKQNYQCCCTIKTSSDKYSNNMKCNTQKYITLDKIDKVFDGEQSENTKKFWNQYVDYNTFLTCSIENWEHDDDNVDIEQKKMALKIQFMFMHYWPKNLDFQNITIGDCFLFLQKPFLL
jgi:hypothetical protein